MPLTGDYEPSPATWVRKQVEKYEATGGTQGNTLKGVPVVVITYLGARSGKLRKTALMRVEHEGCYALVASLGGAPQNPVWHDNLLAHPLIELQDGPAPKDMRVRLVHGEERDSWWERAVAEWPEYADYQRRTDRMIPVFVAEPA